MFLVRLSNKIIALDLAPFSEKVENHFREIRSSLLFPIHFGRSSGSTAIPLNKSSSLKWRATTNFCFCTVIHPCDIDHESKTKQRWALVYTWIWLDPNYRDFYGFGLDPDRYIIQKLRIKDGFGVSLQKWNVAIVFLKNCICLILYFVLILALHLKHY